MATAISPSLSLRQRGSIALPLALASPRGTQEFVTTKGHDPWGVAEGNQFVVYRVLKFVFVALVLFPVRFVVFVLAMLTCYLCALFGTLGYTPPKNLADTKPLSCFRHLFLYPFRFCCRLVLWSCGVWWISEDWQKGSRDPCRMIVANHISFLDVVYLFYRFEYCAVGKAEIMSWPVFGRMFKLTRVIPVDRHQKDSKTQVRHEISRRSTPGSGFPPVLVFPEGTTTNGRVLIHFKNGPFAPGHPVLPICLKYPFRFFDTGNADMMRLFLMMFELVNFMQVTALPVYTPSPEEKADPDLFASNVRGLMATSLNVPVTQHSYEDLFLYTLAQKAHVRQDFEVSKLRSLFDISLEGVEKLLSKFKQLDKGGDGLLTVDDFAKTFGFDTPPPHILKAFEILDPAQTGRVDFKQFLYGLAVLHDKADTDTKIGLAFKLYDLDGNGRLSQEEVSKLLSLCQSSGLVSTAVVKSPSTLVEIEPSATAPITKNESVVVASASNSVVAVLPSHRDSNAPPLQQIDVAKLFEELGVPEEGMDMETFSRVLKDGVHGQLLELPLMLMKSTMLPKSARTHKPTA